ncbi:MAG: GNAT family N-acetyltransferase [Rhodanobacteraceae bacterium]
MSHRVYLRHPDLADKREFLAAVRKSRALHHPWAAPPSVPAQFRVYIEKTTLPANLGFLVCIGDSKRIAGVINITNIVLGEFRSGYLGYYVFTGYEHQGFMREGLQFAVRHAFKSLQLHRLEANIQPANAASIALVKACGFIKEGYSRRYLKIAGRWRDHERWAILAS